MCWDFRPYPFGMLGSMHIVVLRENEEAMHTNTIRALAVCVAIALLPIAVGTASIRKIPASALPGSRER